MGDKSESFFIAEGGNNKNVIMRSWGEHDVVHMRKLDVMVGGEDGMTRLWYVVGGYKERRK